MWPGYTTSPAACARVKERFAGWDCSKRNIFTDQPFDAMVVNYDKDIVGHGTGATEYEAFALAALRASGVEIED